MRLGPFFLARHGACLAVCLIASAARGQVPPPPAGTPVECYDLKFANFASPPAAPFLLNRCTGATWILIRVNLVDAHGAQTQSAWRWAPIHAESAEATFDNLP